MSVNYRALRLSFWILLSITALIVGINLPGQLSQSARTQEPLYLNPVVRGNGQFELRSDRLGKGYFGASRDPNRLHEGIDIAGPIGSPVLASKSGRVIFSGVNGGYGLSVKLLHTDGTETRYAHLSKLNTAQSDWVSRGVVIGQVGNTGNAGHKAIQPHLHFEIREDQKPVNPLKLIHHKENLPS